MIRVQVSIGEIVDKMTILRIKQDKLDGQKLRNVEQELFSLMGTLEESLSAPVLDMLVPYSQELARINKELWDVEDSLRNMDENISRVIDTAQQNGYIDDGEELDNTIKFLKLARSVYNLNDKRAEVKRMINQISGSQIIEEKEYTKYKKTNNATR